LFVVMVKQLLDNATKYSPAGTPIRISVEASAGSIRVCIHNQGLGLTESERAWFSNALPHARSTAERPRAQEWTRNRPGHRARAWRLHRCGRVNRVSERSPSACRSQGERN
jgi:hypothetical protein